MVQREIGISVIIFRYWMIPSAKIQKGYFSIKLFRHSVCALFRSKLVL